MGSNYNFAKNEYFSYPTNGLHQHLELLLKNNFRVFFLSPAIELSSSNFDVFPIGNILEVYLKGTSKLSVNDLVSEYQNYLDDLLEYFNQNQHEEFSSLKVDESVQEPLFFNLQQYPQALVNINQGQAIIEEKRLRIYSSLRRKYLNRSIISF